MSLTWPLVCLVPLFHLPRYLQTTTCQRTRFLTALFFKLSPIGLRAIVAEGTAEFMVIGLVAGLNVGCYLGWLWLLGH